MASSKQQTCEKFSEGEFQFLIAKYLQNGPFQDVGSELIRKLDEQKDASYNHVDPDYIFNVAGQVGQILDEGNRCNNVEGIRSLISTAGIGRLNPLRNAEESRKVQWRTNQLMYSRNPTAPRLVPVGVASSESFPEWPYLSIARKTHGSLPSEIIFSKKFYGGFQLHKRLLGHLAAAFNVIYDRTGKFLITGSDDRLLKLWSAIDGRLLYSFRGHTAEVVIITVNDENTMLGSVATDRTIRIWDLETGSQMAVDKHPTGFISSLKFSPSVRGKTRFLVASSMDGTIMIWKYHSETLKFELGETIINEKTADFPNTKICSISFTSGGTFLASGSADGVVRVYNLLADGGPKKILQRRLHDDRVDSVEYCHVGDRLLTGSRDGTGRIWTYRRQEFSSIMLNSAQSLSVPGSEKHDPRTYKRKVTMVGWSRNDQYALMASDDHIIRVFDSFSGSLCFELTGHTDCVYVLESHPFDTNVYLTAGHDAKIVLWSLIDGSSISCFSQWITGHGPAPFVDAKWNPDGNSFAASDMFGSVNVYGLGKGMAFLKTPDEQFFHTDYRPLMKDAAGFVVDEQTQLAPETMQPPFLVNAGGAPYPPEMQKLVPGRSGIAVQNQVPEEPLPALDAALNALNNQALVPGAPNAEGAPAVAPEVAAAAVHGIRYPTKNDLFSRTYIAKPLDPMLVNSFMRRKLELAKLEVERFHEQNQLPKDKKSCDVQVEFVSAPQPRILTNGEPSSNPLAMAQPGNAQPEMHIPLPPQNGLILPDFDDSDDADFNVDQAEALSDGESASDGDDISIASIEARQIRNRNGHHNNDIGEESNGLETRRSQRKRRAPIHNESDENESEGSVYQEDESFEGPSTSRGPPPRARRDRKAPVVKSRNNNKIVPFKEINGKNNPKKGKGGKSKKEPKVFYRDTDKLWLFPDQDASPPKWLTETLPKRSPYFPQVGDVVYYFLEGHKKFVEKITELKKHRYAAKSLPYSKKTLQIQPVEELKIIKLEFKFSAPLKDYVRVAEVTVQRMNCSEGIPSVFDIRFFEEQDVEDFLVLKQFVDKSLEMQLVEGMRVRSMFQDDKAGETACQWYTGTVVSINDAAFERVAYHEISVRWGGADSKEDPEDLSPWDLFHLPENGLPESDGEAVTPREIIDLAYQPEADDWPEVDLGLEIERIASLLKLVTENSVSEHFKTPVDFHGFPDYPFLVPYPCDLSMILQRLENRFYRRQSALLFDIRQIALNSEIYNGAELDVTKNAHIVADVCEEIVMDRTIFESIVLPLKNARAYWAAEFKKDRVKEKKDREAEAESARMKEAMEELSDIEEKEEEEADDDDTGSEFSPEAEESEDEDMKEAIKLSKKVSSVSDEVGDSSSENGHPRQPRHSRPKRMTGSHSNFTTSANRPQRTKQKPKQNYRCSSEESEVLSHRQQAKQSARKRPAPPQNPPRNSRTNGEPPRKKTRRGIKQEPDVERTTKSGRSAVTNYAELEDGSEEEDYVQSPVTSNEDYSSRSSRISRSESLQQQQQTKTTRSGRAVKQRHLD